MKQIELKVTISEHLFANEYDYTFGSRKDEVVDFTFINIRTGKETTKRHFSYTKALALAHYRSMDGRCKNFEYHISEVN